MTTSSAHASGNRQVTLQVEVPSDTIRDLLADLEGSSSDGDELSIEVDQEHRGGSFAIVDSEGFPLFTLQIYGTPNEAEAALESREVDELLTD